MKVRQSIICFVYFGTIALNISLAVCPFVFVTEITSNMVKVSKLKQHESKSMYDTGQA